MSFRDSRGFVGFPAVYFFTGSVVSVSTCCQRRVQYCCCWFFFITFFSCLFRSFTFFTRRVYFFSCCCTKQTLFFFFLTRIHKVRGRTKKRRVLRCNMVYSLGRVLFHSWPLELFKTFKSYKSIKQKFPASYARNINKIIKKE